MDEGPMPDEQPSEPEMTSRVLVLGVTCPACGHQHEVKLNLMSVPEGKAN